MADDLSLQSVRGMRDILPKDQTKWQYVRTQGEEVARIFGFERIDVPVVEYVDLFDRGIGKETDIASKELFMVSQKEGSQARQMALRPEFTAGITRAYLQNGLSSQPQPVRLYSIGPVFRYDRPQKGRYREHVQLSLETLGTRKAASDAWIIYLGWTFLKRLGLHNIQVQINTLGSSECQKEFAAKLIEYLTPFKDKLSPVDLHRLEVNPLRVLDSKNETTKKLCEDAPQTIDCLDKDSKQFFKDVLSYLDEYGVSYNLNPNIVRGLDYYKDTVFEFTTDTGDTPVALGGGGRYDLASQLGENSLPSIGMGFGLDRVVLEMAHQKVKTPSAYNSQCDIFVVHLSKRGRKKAQEVMESLHNVGFVTLHAADKSSLRAQLKSADRAGAKYAVIIGETEAKNDMCILRDMKSGIQEDSNCDDLVTLLIDRIKNHRSAKCLAPLPSS